MIYKRYELSQSLNGDKIVHIARSASGFVVFREPSETALKKAIDESIKKEQEQKELAAQGKTDKKKRPERLFAKPKEESKEKTVDVEIKTEETREPKPVSGRGVDGKFIKKIQLEQEEPKKGSFWNKLR